MIEVVWFKRDLRVEDHAALCAARGRVLCLHVIEPAFWRGEDASPRQWRFARAALADLRARLAALGLPLVVRVGEAVEVLADLHARHGIAALHSHEETGNLWTYARDRAVGRFCRAHGIPWREQPQPGVIRRLADRDHWAARVAAQMDAPPLAPPRGLIPCTEEPEGEIPEEPCAWNPADGLARPQPAGRAAALGLLESFLAGRGSEYRRGMSSPLTAGRVCSRLSPHLAFGSLSLREAVRRVREGLAALEAMEARARPIPPGAAQSLLSRLHWRAHFMQKLESEPALEIRAAHPAAEAARRPTAPDDARLRAWAEGRTGWPFLDACMRALIAEGWITFRMRAMLQAVASHHLALDWRASGLVLARRFTDYEPGIHWPQVQMQSAATGINAPRLYNPIKQGLDHDPEGRFIARWIPELAPLPPVLRHMPWKGEPGLYPPPLLDAAEAARAARARLAAQRAAPGFEAAARAVFARHGSRQRRLHEDDPMARRAREAARAARARRQLRLDL
ncbi:FAD-binding domain-containing protein [Rubritepida flocculans]|uniref:FAD-binding domain-containing protein n=1 Tax=Rubritepida flocculans TaxID=182403 RepID=UPI0004196CA4|nr:FAD-binding domain-containing protein [Rubritepida flocculans]